MTNANDAKERVSSLDTVLKKSLYLVEINEIQYILLTTDRAFQFLGIF